MHSLHSPEVPLFYSWYLSVRSGRIKLELFACMWFFFLNMSVHVMHVISMYSMPAHRVWTLKCLGMWSVRQGHRQSKWKLWPKTMKLCLTCQWTGKQALGCAHFESSIQTNPLNCGFVFSWLLCCVMTLENVVIGPRTETKHLHHRHIMPNFLQTFGLLLFVFATINLSKPLSSFLSLFLSNFLFIFCVLSQVSSGVCSSPTEPGGWEDTDGEWPNKF